ncbi:MAG TPA: PQQ-dependent sugar dehydrogenase [Thermoanaerobaculia bacterium]|nr:PQQ-dependent sugar dehydrogenase [Thermoanaerobaculia bacterium]
MLDRRRSFGTLLFLVFALAPSSRAATLPPGFVETRLATGLDRPTAMTVAPDGRVFVCEEKGRLRVIKNGALLAKPFVTVKVFAHGERGLLGVVLDPEFEENGFVYVYYTARKPVAHNRLSRFTADGDTAKPGSEKVLLELPPLVTELHNSGTLRFGPDGKLYVSVGENFLPELAQRLDNPLGKILRVNRDGSIPSDNPFFSRTTGLARAIWAMGLRNPFSFAFERGTSRMFINDVGHRTWEEINEGIAGANYGWPEVEGPANDPRFRAPLFAYAHGGGSEKGCAITGGAFYDAPVQAFPEEFRGTYFFSDYCNGWIRRFDPASGEVEPFAAGIPSPIGLTVREDGSLYYLAHHGGEVYQVRFTASQKPAISVQPGDLKVAVGESATFAVEASGAAPLAYQWRRNGAPIPGATAKELTIGAASLADEGARFEVTVSNSFGSVKSREARLTVVNGHRPTVAILAPTNGILFRAGDTIAFRGSGTDAEDGALPASALTWRIDFHHDDHLHPFLLDTSGITEGSFTIPTLGETAPVIWYRIHLTAKDSDGLVAETFVDVLPRHSTFRVETDPAGLKVTLDGNPKTAPFSEVGVVGITRTLGALSPQTLGPDLYEFLSWSDGGAAAHTVSTPEVDTTWTAIFRKVVAADGIGLTGTYFNGPGLSGPNRVRIDPVVNFNWGTESPLPGVGPDNWSARWTGQIEAEVSGLHTFYVRSDDGARLWVNEVLVVDDWTDHLSRVKQGTIQLQGSQRYSIRLEYHDTKGEAGVRLLWSAPGILRQVVPASQLFP